MIRIARSAAFALAAGLASCADTADVPPAATGRPQKSVEARPPLVDPLPSPVAPIVAPKPERDPDDERREKLVGVWKQNYTGVRWLSIRPDGTATMFIDPDWVAKAVIGGGLTMQIEWVVEDGRALFKSISGEPESAFKAVNALFGRDRNRPIVELTADKFVLLDEEDGSRSEWTRAKPDEKLPAALEGEVSGER